MYGIIRTHMVIEFNLQPITTQDQQVQLLFVGTGHIVSVKVEEEHVRVMAEWLGGIDITNGQI